MHIAILLHSSPLACFSDCLHANDHSVRSISKPSSLWAVLDHLEHLFLDLSLCCILCWCYCLHLDLPFDSLHDQHVQVNSVGMLFSMKYNFFIWLQCWGSCVPGNHPYDGPHRAPTGCNVSPNQTTVERECCREACKVFDGCSHFILVCHQMVAVVVSFHLQPSHLPVLLLLHDQGGQEHVEEEEQSQIGVQPEWILWFAHIGQRGIQCTKVFTM